MRTLTESIADLLLGPPGRQRVRASQTLLSLLTCIGFAFVQQAEVMGGLMAQDESLLLTAYVLGGGVLFYLLIRSGLNERLSSDPSLTLPQTVYAMLGVGWCYAITGPARGAVISMMVLIVLFGVFVLDEKRAKFLSALGFVLLAGGAVIGIAAGAFDPRVEAVHLGLAAIIMAAGGVLGVRMTRMRHRLRAQKTELAEALERIRLLATRDPLTGLLNRRAMLEVMSAEASGLRRSGEILTVALIDLDHFKHINDRLGHAMGDRVLETFAEVARRELRGGDVVARWGGEEFLMMLPRTSASQGVHCLQRIREALARHRFGDGESPVAPTFSAGLARCRDAADLAAAIERADQAMYRAKTGGRNRSEVDVLAFADLPGVIPEPAAPHASERHAGEAPLPGTRPMHEAV